MKEKIKRLEIYRQAIKDRLTSPTPAKHKNHPETYKQYLERELQAVSNKIEAIKLGDV